MVSLPIFWKQRARLARWMVRTAVKVDGSPGCRTRISHEAPKGWPVGAR